MNQKYMGRPAAFNKTEKGGEVRNAGWMNDDLK
jgi:hypothetical protein